MRASHVVKTLNKASSPYESVMLQEANPSIVQDIVDGLKNGEKGLLYSATYIDVKPEDTKKEIEKAKKENRPPKQPVVNAILTHINKGDHSQSNSEPTFTEITNETADSNVKTLQQKYSTEKMLIIDAGSRYCATVHFPSVSKRAGAEKNITTLKTMLEDLRKLATPEKPVELCGDFNLPFTMDSSDKLMKESDVPYQAGDDTIKTLDLAAVLDGITGVSVKTGKPYPKQRDSSMATNEQFTKGGKQVIRCTMASFTITTGEEPLTVEVAEAESMLSPDNPNDHQNIDMGGTLSLNLGYTGREDVETTRQNNTRQHLLREHGLLQRYEAAMQDSAMQAMALIKKTVPPAPPKDAKKTA